MYRLDHVVITDLDVSDRFDRVPTENLTFVTAGDGHHHALRRGRWGLVPWKAKEVPPQNLFNARVEIVDTSSAFKDAWVCKRCLVPADGFYVVGKDDGETWFVHKPGGKPFSFAGLWAHNGRLGITSCALITVPATEPLMTLHKTQPVVLAPESYDAWLDAATPSEDLMRLLGRPEDTLEFHRVNSNEDAGEERTSDASDGKTSPSVREARKDHSAPRQNVSPSEGPNEIFIDRNDPLLARRTSIVSFNCQHAGCKNVAFWGYSPNGQGPRNWFCNEHRADGEALLGRQQPKQAATAGYVR